MKLCSDCAQIRSNCRSEVPGAIWFKNCTPGSPTCENSRESSPEQPEHASAEHLPDTPRTPLTVLRCAHQPASVLKLCSAEEADYACQAAA